MDLIDQDLIDQDLIGQNLIEQDLRTRAPRKQPVLSDLVRDSKIETEFLASHVQHVLYETGRSASNRRVRRMERWTIDKLLGQGTFGKVHLHICNDGDKERLRAVKEVKKFVKGQELDYTRELEAIMKFSHSKYNHCFVSSQGWYELKDSIFITMEFFELGDLQQYITAPLPESEVKQITNQVLEGLTFMHDNRFIHRDLKPANIMVVDHSPDWFVKIADFGISRRPRQDTGPLTMHCGTFGFVAPEVISSVSETPYNYSVDIWSLGAMAYRLLANTMAFQNMEDLFNYGLGLLEFPIDPLTSFGVSKRGQDFIFKLMQSSPSARLSALTAASHPWLSTQHGSENGGISETRNTVLAEVTGLSIASKAWSSEGRSMKADRSRETRTRSGVPSLTHEAINSDSSAPMRNDSDESASKSGPQRTIDSRALRPVPNFIPHFGQEPVSASAVVGPFHWKKFQVSGLYKSQARTLHEAAKNGIVERANQLLEIGADVTSRDNNGNTPLSLAALDGHEAIVKLLVEAGADINTKNKTGSTPLLHAASKGNEPMARLLVKAGATLEVKNHKGSTPLHNAAFNGYEAVVKLLVDAGADFEAKNDNGNTPLHDAAINGHEAVAQLLVKAGANLEVTDNNSNTPLHNAAYKGHEAVVKLLVKAGANLEAKGGFIGGTPLHGAAFNGHEAVVKLLAEAGADLRSENRLGNTPLCNAATHGHKSMAKLLVEMGANINAEDEGGYRPLNWARELLVLMWYGN